MPLDEMQKIVDAWAQKNGGYWQPHEILARLAEENGELAREINHRFGPKRKKSTEDVGDVAGELGDILFTVTCMANRLGISLDDAFAHTMEKYGVRDANRWKKPPYEGG